MKKSVRYMMVVITVAVMSCGLNGCSSRDNENTEQTVTEAVDEQIVEQDSFGGKEESALNEKRNDTETVLNEEHNDIEKASSGEDLDVAVPNAADDDWYVKGNIYTDDKGNRLEVFFNDYGTLEFAMAIMPEFMKPAVIR